LKPSTTLSYGSLCFDYASLHLQTEPEGPLYELSLKEAKLLKLFMQQPQTCLPRQLIKEAVWGQVSVSPRTIDSQISRLRRRLASSGVQIENLYGDGYLLT